MSWKGEGEPASVLLDTWKVRMIAELEPRIANLIRGGECSIGLRLHVHCPPGKRIQGLLVLRALILGTLFACIGAY